MHHAEALKHLRQFERADLRVLLRVIDGAAAALKLDAHGDWIVSSGGSIVCNCGLFTIHVGCRSRQRRSANGRKHWRRGVADDTDPPLHPSKPM